MEIGELEALRSARVTLVKNFITSRVDEYRPPYARQKIKVPRSCVFIGTTNESEYLADATGARRYWPVPVGRVNLAKLKEDRDQLWAEALHAYRSGARWWPATEDVADCIASVQESRYNCDDWERLIRKWLKGRESTTNGETLEGALNLEPAKWDRRAQMRAGIAIRRLGWVKVRVQVDGAREWHYIPGPDAKVR